MLEESVEVQRHNGKGSPLSKEDQHRDQVKTSTPGAIYD